jgi:hypothetical protein
LVAYRDDHRLGEAVRDGSGELEQLAIDLDAVEEERDNLLAREDLLEEIILVRDDG